MCFSISGLLLGNDLYRCIWASNKLLKRGVWPYLFLAFGLRPKDKYFSASDGSLSSNALCNKVSAQLSLTLNLAPREIK